MSWIIPLEQSNHTRWAIGCTEIEAPYVLKMLTTSLPPAMIITFCTSLPCESTQRRPFAPWNHHLLPLHPIHWQWAANAKTRPKSPNIIQHLQPFSTDECPVFVLVYLNSTIMCAHHGGRSLPWWKLGATSAGSGCSVVVYAVVV
jgi:hypothetical protein